MSAAAVYVKYLKLGVRMIKPGQEYKLVDRHDRKPYYAYVIAVLVDGRGKPYVVIQRKSKHPRCVYTPKLVTPTYLCGGTICE